MALVLVSMYATQQTRLNALQKWYSVVMNCHSSYARTLMAREQHPCAAHDVKMQYRNLRSNGISPTYLAESEGRPLEAHGS